MLLTANESSGFYLLSCVLNHSLANVTCLLSFIYYLSCLYLAAHIFFPSMLFFPKGCLHPLRWRAGGRIRTSGTPSRSGSAARCIARLCHPGTKKLFRIKKSLFGKETVLQCVKNYDNIKPISFPKRANNRYNKFD